MGVLHVDQAALKTDKARLKIWGHSKQAGKRNLLVAGPLRRKEEKNLKIIENIERKK